MVKLTALPERALEKMTSLRFATGCCRSQICILIPSGVNPLGSVQVNVGVDPLPEIATLETKGTKGAVPTDGVSTDF